MNWQERLGLASVLDNVLERRESAVVAGLSGQVPTVFVHEIGDESLEVIDRHVGLPVHLWSLASLQRVGEVAARRILISGVDALDPAPLDHLNSVVRELALIGLPLRARSLRMECLGAVEELSAAWEMVDPETGIDPRLARVAFFDAGPPTLSSIPASESLRSIALSVTPMVSLDGLERFSNLTALEIASAPRLRDFDALLAAGLLESLEFSSVPVSSGLGQIGALTKLQMLGISDARKIPTIGALRGHQTLQTVLAYGTTSIVDGDLTPFLEMPRLQQLWIADRRHYRPRVGEVKRRLGIEE